MMTLALTFGALLVLPASAVTTGQFSDCLSEYYVQKSADGDKPSCKTIVQFGRCLATSGVNDLPATNSVRISAETVYLTAQQENQDCANHDDHSVDRAAKVRAKRGGDLEFDVHEEKDVHLFRFRRETVSLFDISDTSQQNKKDIAELKASVAADIKTLTDDVKATNDTMVKDVAALVTELKEDAAAAEKKTNDLITEMKQNFSAFAEQLAADTAEQVKAVTEDTKKQISEIPKPYHMTPFYRWGARSCPSGIDTWYDGIHYNGHQGHGGGADHLCIRNADRGANGGNHIGSSSYDLLYPGSVDHQQGTGVARNSIIPCAMCMSKTPCMEVRGRKDCPANYEMVYRGYVFGNHHSHRLSGDRICIDGTFNDRSKGYGDYRSSWLYATRIQNTASGSRITRYDSVACGVCCYKGD